MGWGFIGKTPQKTLRRFPPSNTVITQAVQKRRIQAIQDLPARFARALDNAIIVSPTQSIDAPDLFFLRHA